MLLWKSTNLTRTGGRRRRKTITSTCIHHKCRIVLFYILTASRHATAIILTVARVLWWSILGSSLYPNPHLWMPKGTIIISCPQTCMSRVQNTQGTGPPTDCETLRLLLTGHRLVSLLTFIFMHYHLFNSFIGDKTPKLGNLSSFIHLGFAL